MSADPSMLLPGRPLWRVTSGEPAPDEVARLLGLLPGWFGIEAANAHYIEQASVLPAYLAWPDEASRPAGVLLALRHFPKSAEVYLLAVDPALHRSGAGRALLRALEADLAADGVELLQVKTLGPSSPDEGYAKTRAFYEAMGFRPLEETRELWESGPCLIMVKVLWRPSKDSESPAPPEPPADQRSAGSAPVAVRRGLRARIARVFGRARAPDSAT